MAKKSSPLLELSTDIERDYILIDGEQCPIKTTQELSIVDIHWLHKRYQISQALFTRPDMSEEEIDKLNKTVNEFVDFVFIKKPKSAGKLTDGMKFDIMMAFTKLFLKNLPARAEAITDSLSEFQKEQTAENEEATEATAKTTGLQ